MKYKYLLTGGEEWCDDDGADSGGDNDGEWGNYDYYTDDDNDDDEGL